MFQYNHIINPQKRIGVFGIGRPELSMSTNLHKNTIIMGIFKLRYFNLTISNKSEIDINPNMLTLKVLNQKDLTFTYEENIPFLKHHDKLTIPIKVFSNFDNKEYTITADTSIAFTPVTINLVNDSSLTSMTLITQSISYSLLDNIDTADFCAVGGGGGGGSEVAGGGGGGYAQNLLNYSLSGTNIRFTIGGGGGPSSDSYNYDAGSGGRTTIAIDNSEILGANGGGGAGKKSFAGGTGNGNGGYNSTNATNGTVRVFNDSSLPLPGGGGAGNSSSAGQGFGGSKNSAGGVPGGGASQGGNTKYSGGAGGVYVRVRYKS